MRNFINIVEGLVQVRKYKDRSFYDVLNDFKKVGGEILGSGTHAMILWHPKWNYVFKIFNRDDAYLTFIRFTKRNPMPAFPVVLGGPWKIVPFYKRKVSEPFLYVVKLEKLHPITDQELKRNLPKYVDEGLYYIDSNKQFSDEEGQKGIAEYKEIIKDYENTSDRREKRKMLNRMHDFHQWGRYDQILELWKKHPSLKSLTEAYAFIMKHGKGAPDNHSGNYMQREDGTLVMIDPFWEGETPYQAYDRVMRSEIDYGGDDSEEENEYNTLRGGQIRPKKKPKPAPYVSDEDDNDTPF